jgi:hypothetical protein
VTRQPCIRASRLASKLLVAPRTQRIWPRAVPIVSIATPMRFAPTQRPPGMSSLICFGRVQQRVFILLLIPTMLRSTIVVIGASTAGFNLGRPDSVVAFCRFAGDVVWIGGFGFVGENAIFAELDEVVCGHGGCEGKEDAIGGAISKHTSPYGNEGQRTYNTTTPTPTDALLTLHLRSLPHMNVVQLRWSLGSFLSCAPCLMPEEFHSATATKAANQSMV